MHNNTTEALVRLRRSVSASLRSGGSFRSGPIRIGKRWLVAGLLGALCLCPLLGCGWVSPTRAKALAVENRRLSEEAKAQVAEIENLKVHSRTIEDRLIRSEKELELYAQQNGLTREELANLRRERERLRDHLFTPGGRVPTGVSGELAQLAQQYPSLHYDPATGISKLETDILFETGDAELKPGAERLLRAFAAVLRSPQAKRLKVMVVGHTDDQRVKGRETRHQYPTNWHLSSARSLAVADVLRQEGVDGERLGVAGFGPYQPIAPNDSITSRQQNRRVEIFVMSPEVPIVGMTDTLIDLY